MYIEYYVSNFFGPEREQALKLPRDLLRGYNYSILTSFKSAPKLNRKILYWLLHFNNISSKDKYIDSTNSILLSTNLMI
jgi:hypothetical protein